MSGNIVSKVINLNYNFTTFHLKCLVMIKCSKRSLSLYHVTIDNKGQHGTQRYHQGQLALGNSTRGQTAKGSMGKGESGHHCQCKWCLSTALCQTKHLCTEILKSPVNLQTNCTNQCGTVTHTLSTKKTVSLVISLCTQRHEVYKHFHNNLTTSCRIHKNSCFQV